MMTIGVHGTAGHHLEPGSAHPVTPAALSLALLFLILASNAAWSQEPSTREEADRQQREQKAKDLRSYEPNGVERWLHFAENRAIFTRVFAAWLNHDDSRGINSLDMLETTGDRGWIKHYLFDFGSILGSGTVYAQRHRPGNEYLFEQKPGWLTLATLGLYVRPWMTIDYPQISTERVIVTGSNDCCSAPATRGANHGCDLSERNAGLPERACRAATARGGAATGNGGRRS